MSSGRQFVKVNKDKVYNHLMQTDVQKIPIYNNLGQVGDEPGMEGNIILDRDTSSFCYHDGTTWVCINAAVANGTDCTTTPVVIVNPFPVLEHFNGEWTETAVSGTSLEANGTIIESYLVNGNESQFLASAIVVGGAWTIYVGGGRDPPAGNVDYPKLLMPSVQPITPFISFADLYVYARAPCKTTSPPNIVSNGVRIEMPGVECFTCDAQVAVPGSSRQISQINVGDTVLGYNFDTNMLETDTVIRVARVKHENLIILTFNDGTIVTSTHDHPYYVNGKGWSSLEPSRTQTLYSQYKRVSPIEIGDTFLSVNGSQKILQSLTKKRGLETTYTLELNNNNAFIVHDLVVGVERQTGVERQHFPVSQRHPVGQQASQQIVEYVI